MPHLHVVLVPGFFGFGRLGDISYFAGVRSALERAFAEQGLSVSVTEVSTLPTASVRVRAARVLEVLAALVAKPGDIHIIGHSTGGLDARLAIAATASLPTAVRFDAYHRIRSVVSVSCPHYGTNVSTFFTRPLGRALFRLVTRYCVFMLERGRLPLGMMLRVGYFVLRLRDPWKRRRSTFDELYERLLGDLSAERRLELSQFLRSIGSRQELLFQLTPAGCDLLNACTLDPPVRYGSVVACASPPRFRTLLRSMISLYSQLMYPLYWLLHRLAREKGDALREQLSDIQSQALELVRVQSETSFDVEQLDGAFVGDEQVLWRDVAVHDAERLLRGSAQVMCVVQAIERRDPNHRHGFQAQSVLGLVGSLQHVLEWLPFEELHHDAVAAVEHAESMRSHDVLVVQAQSESRFVEEHSNGGRVLQMLRVHAFDDD